MNNNVFFALLHLSHSPIYLHIFFLHGNLQKLILFIGFLVQLISVNNQKNHKQQHHRHFYNDHYDGGDNDHDIIGKDISAKGILIGDGL